MQLGADCRSWEDQIWCGVLCRWRRVLVISGGVVRGVRCWEGVVMRTREGGTTVDLELTECRLYQQQSSAYYRET